MTTRRVAAAVGCGIRLSGCAAGVGRMPLAADPGMDEAGVIAALGLAAAFGVDDRGRRCLQYGVLRVGARLFTAGTGPIGVNATAIQASASGFDARVYLQRGRVIRVATRAWLEDGRPGAEASAPGPEASRRVRALWQHGRPLPMDAPA